MPQEIAVIGLALAKNVFLVHAIAPDGNPVVRRQLRRAEVLKFFGKLRPCLVGRWKRWGEMGVFHRMMDGLAAEAAEPRTLMIDATYLKAHRTASSLRVKRGARAADWPHQKGA